MRRSIVLALLAATLTGAAAPARPDWPGFVHRFVETDFQLDPGTAQAAGRHDLDGRLPDWSPAGLARRASFLRGAIADAAAYRDTDLTADQRFERDYLVQVARGKLFWLTDADQPHHNPAFYLGGGLDPAIYTSRPYAAPAVRMRAMIAYLRGVPAAAAQMRANLAAPQGRGMPASFVRYGITAFGGLADFYATDGKQAFADVRDPALQRAYDEAARPAAAAMRGLADWLKTNQATASQDFALGPARFARMLAETEDVHIPLDRLEAIGRADLARNTAALKVACARYLPGATLADCMAKAAADKPADAPVAAARAQLPALRAFVDRNHLVSIPGTEEARVALAPPYNAQNAAYIDPPGPFDRGVPSIYYIAPPDPAWSKAQQLAYIPSKGALMFTTVHEVMPGHFVQFLHSNRAPSEIGRVYIGYAYAEGWAHYCEQMMWDAGAVGDDAELHVGQIEEALLRDVRFLSAIGLHTRGMTLEQSRRMFLDQAFQDPGNAEQQAARGTYDPAYLSYTLGKLMILKLRDDWTATRGGRAAWGAFHDRFLGDGGPPIPLLRARMGLAGPAL